MLQAPSFLCAVLLFLPSSPSPQILVHRVNSYVSRKARFRHYLWLGPTSDRINSYLICVPTVLQTSLYYRAVFHLSGKLFISLFSASHLPSTQQVCKRCLDELLNKEGTLLPGPHASGGCTACSDGPANEQAPHSCISLGSEKQPGVGLISHFNENIPLWSLIMTLECLFSTAVSTRQSIFTNTHLFLS